MTDMSAMFERLAAASEAAASGSVSPLPEPVSAEGASADGAVTATMAGGKLTSVRIDAHAMRRGNAEVGDAVVEAVNAAIEAHTQLTLAALNGPGTDFAKLSRELTEIGDQAQRSMNANLEAMREMLARATAQATGS